LGFLITDYGFSDPISEKDNNTLTIYLKKREIAIEVYLDERDEMISFRIICLDDGKIPDCYRMNRKGKVVKEYLSALLKHRGVKDLSFNEPTVISDLSKRENEFRRSLLIETYWLKKYGQDILEGSAKIFDGYNEPGDRF
jgi:hypothetical protein